MSKKSILILTGLIFGIGAVLLVHFGNPGNYGFCAACQLRDIAGALGLHQTATLQYARPEIIGIILGSFLLALATKQFCPRGGSAPLLKFFYGMVMMIGALIFLGCPLRALLRLAGGDLNGLTAIIGFIAGIMTAIVFLKKGYALPDPNKYEAQKKIASFIGPLFFFLLFIALLSGILYTSVQGPGSLHAPILISLIAGLLAGGAAQQTRLCMSGGIRNYILTKNTDFLIVYAVILVSAGILNLVLGQFQLGFSNQPLSHTMHLWNFLSLYLVGLAAILGGGCPLRQMVLSGEGSVDALFSVIGMLVGAGLAHRLNAAGSPKGVSETGQIILLLCIITTLAVAFFITKQSLRKEMPLDKNY